MLKLMLKVLNLMVIGSLRSLKSVKPNWMVDVEGVNCLLMKWKGVR